MTTNTDTDTTSSGTDSRKDGPLPAAARRVGDAYAAARERTGAVYGSARETASRAGRRTAQGVDSYPEAAILGGLAFGAVLAALLPRTDRESRALGDFGRRINDTARQAARAAKDAGRSTLEEAGLSRDAARQKLTDIAASARDAARSSATAAAQTVRGSQQ